MPLSIYHPRVQALCNRTGCSDLLALEYLRQRDAISNKPAFGTLMPRVPALLLAIPKVN